MVLTRDFEDHFRHLIDDGSVVGAAVGAIKGDETSTAFVGRIETASGEAADERTFFEIGSITKTFTALLLADMVVRGEAGLDEPISKYLPGLASAPIGTATLVNLATHTSGLPRDPETVDWEQGDPAYAAMSSYSLDELLAGVSRFDLGATETDASYSNVGFALLGHVLATVASVPYAELVAQRVCVPLGLGDTKILKADDPPDPMAVGHDEDGHPLPSWSLAGLAPAGGLVSSLRDMLRYAAAIIDPEETPLAEAIRSTTSPRVKLALDEPSERNLGVGLGWITETRAGSHCVWHTGGTHGFGSMLAVGRDRGTAVVVLANSAHSEELDLAAFSLLDSLG